MKINIANPTTSNLRRLAGLLDKASVEGTREIGPVNVDLLRSMPGTGSTRNHCCTRSIFAWRCGGF